MAPAEESLRAELADVRAQVGRLRRDIAEVVAASEGSNADDEHDPEGATIGFERAQLAALLDAARRREADVERALAQVREGGYGRCERCGGPIGTERLATRPSTRRCVACAAQR
ncbi:MAG TPA: TraR/DksA C4-type zinc finger protein [Mycobacteriales bacterium]|nr:TraR/DksA C4-type zinc finger protein [Mycobacteriales bacterium]